MKKTQRSYNSTLRKVSSKQAKRDREWKKAKQERREYLEEKYGYAICELCKGREGYEFHALVGHHNDHDRSNNTMENCRLVHVICHSKIHDNNLEVE